LLLQLQEVLRLAIALQQQLQGSQLFPVLQQQLQLAVHQVQWLLLSHRSIDKLLKEDDPTLLAKQLLEHSHVQ
jgi:hypothetical protein